MNVCPVVSFCIEQKNLPPAYVSVIVILFSIYVYYTIPFCKVTQWFV